MGDFDRSKRPLGGGQRQVTSRDDGRFRIPKTLKKLLSDKIAPTGDEGNPVAASGALVVGFGVGGKLAFFDFLSVPAKGSEGVSLEMRIGLDELRNKLVEQTE